MFRLSIIMHRSLYLLPNFLSFSKVNNDLSLSTLPPPQSFQSACFGSYFWFFLHLPMVSRYTFYRCCHINTYICSILFFLKISLLDTSFCFCRDWPVSGMLGGWGGVTAANREGVWEKGSGQLCLQMRNQASRDPESQCGWWGSRQSTLWGAQGLKLDLQARRCATAPPQLFPCQLASVATREVAASERQTGTNF